ncbi:MAG: 5-dehydro-2-deoxygluconokinase [Pseudomonadota bacterium]
MKDLDIVAIGRAGVDLYGDQTGGRLEDMRSFSKYIGGSPTNTVIGAARLGAKTALISRVGDDAMGRFITEELAREGVGADHVITDPARMTALVLLGIRDSAQFPLIFYRENCADMAICEDDIDEALIARARAVVTSGTHFSTPKTKAASLRALALAAKHGAQRWIDLDYRPVLWGLGSKGDGETRFIADATVTDHLKDIMPHLDVVVGTEEEFHIAGGSEDTLACLRVLRALTGATFVVKLGPMGCVVFDGAIPATLDEGRIARGFPVEVFNVLGAGDAFMGGLLTGFLEGRGWEEACQFANACGAFAVSRHACAPAYPSRAELDHFLTTGSEHFRLREDERLERLHRNSTRHGQWPEVLAFAFDHRAQFEEIESDPARIGAFKSLCAEVALSVAAGTRAHQIGVLCDHRLGQTALDTLTAQGLWIATPIEHPGARPLLFEGGPSLATTLRVWPREHVVKCLCPLHPDDPAGVWDAQRARLKELYAVTRAEGLELLLEIIPPDGAGEDASTLARAMELIYQEGITPDWWKLRAPSSADWRQSWDSWSNVITSHDPQCRGVLLLGLDAPLPDLRAALARARGEPLCKGFAIGRTIFGDVARAWFAGQVSDEAAKAEMQRKFADLIEAWAP